MDPSAGDKLEWCEIDEGHISIILTFNRPLLALHTLTARPKLLIMFTEQQGQHHTHFLSWRVHYIQSVVRSQQFLQTCQVQYSWCYLHLSTAKTSTYTVTSHNIDVLSLLSHLILPYYDVKLNVKIERFLCSIILIIYNFLIFITKKILDIHLALS